MTPAMLYDSTVARPPCSTGDPVAAPVVQVRIPEDMLAAVDGARGDGTRTPL